MICERMPFDIRLRNRQITRLKISNIIARLITDV